MALSRQLRGRLVGVLNIYFASPGDLHRVAEQRAAAIADLVAIVRQRLNRKFSVIAEELVATGTVAP